MEDHIAHYKNVKFVTSSEFYAYSGAFHFSAVDHVREDCIEESGDKAVARHGFGMIASRILLM